jgi:hypothetical protein
MHSSGIEPHFDLAIILQMMIVSDHFNHELDEVVPILDKSVPSLDKEIGPVTQ